MKNGKLTGQKTRKMEICIDFDGTCVSHEFPNVGKDIGAVPVLKKLVDAGHRLILFTMRSNRISVDETEDHTIMNVQGNFLDDAINWFKEIDYLQGVIIITICVNILCI